MRLSEFPPCYNDGKQCPERTPGCHGTCKKYISWDSERKELRRKINEEKKKSKIARQFEVDRIRRIKKRQGKKG